MLNAAWRAVRYRAVTLSIFVGSIWVVSLSNTFFGLGLAKFGVQPRTMDGLLGVATAPWLHASYGHLIANTSGLLILGWLTMWPHTVEFIEATLGAIVGAGLSAWLFGNPHSVHIGASGVVFGYAGYLMARGLYCRRFYSIAIAILVAGGYGLSMLGGILPIYPGISWQSHLGGFVGGVFVAKALMTHHAKLEHEPFSGGATAKRHL